MKTGIKTLTDSWLFDNREYIAENYILCTDWLGDFQDWPNWQYDFFTSKEVEEKTEEELINIVKSYIKENYFGYTIKEYFDLMGWDWDF